MIDRENHPLGWDSFLDELSDAHEHLGNLLKDISETPDYSEEDLR
jgi:hypothetical protein